MKAVVTVTVLCAFLVATPRLGGSEQAAREQQSRAGQKPDMKMCREMAARHQKMMEEVKAMDARLDQEMKAMQAAQGQAKVDAIARVVTTLVEQRREMRERAMTMHAEASGHMTQHAGQDASAMTQCPMMQQMMKRRP